MAAEIMSASVTSLTPSATVGVSTGGQNIQNKGEPLGFAQVMAGQQTVQAAASATGSTRAPAKPQGKEPDSATKKPSDTSLHKDQLAAKDGNTLPPLLPVGIQPVALEPLSTTVVKAGKPDVVNMQKDKKAGTDMANNTVPLFPVSTTDAAEPLTIGTAVAQGSGITPPSILAANASKTTDARNSKSNIIPQAPLNTSPTLVGNSADAHAPQHPLLVQAAEAIAVQNNATSAWMTSLTKSPDLNSVGQPGAALPNMTVLGGVTPTAAPIPAVAVVAPPVGSNPQWGQALGQQVQFLLGQGVQQATLHLNPPHLGPLEVHLDIQQNGQTNAFFSSAHPEVLEAISTAIPQLQASFAAAGMSLTQTSVSADSGGRPFARGKSTISPRIAALDEAGAHNVLPVAVRMQLGLVNTFA